MRIIAGKYRAKKLFTPENKEVRPTSDRAREAVFSIIYSRLGSLSGCKVLDIFAGTGAFGFEALSRGAESICFIDKDVKLVRKNLNLFDKEISKVKVICSDALCLPPALSGYNLIFSDAPYAQDLSQKALEEAAAKGWIEENALCLVETRKDEELNLSSAFKLTDTRMYGLAKVWIYVYKKL